MGPDARKWLKKLTVRASATTTTRNWARYWLAIPRKKGSTDLGVIITYTICTRVYSCVHTPHSCVCVHTAVSRVITVYLCYFFIKLSNCLYLTDHASKLHTML